VLNGVRVWTGSTNLTESGLYGQANVAHVVFDGDIAGKYLEYWGELKEDRTTKEMAEFNGDELPEIEAAEESVSVVFSPRKKKSPLLARWAEIFGAAKGEVAITAAFTLNKLLLEECMKETGARRYILKEKEAKTDEEVERLPENRVVRGAVMKEGAVEGWVGEELTGLNEHVRFVHWKVRRCILAILHPCYTAS